MFLLDALAKRQMFQMAADILEQIFFYEEDEIDKFLEIITIKLNHEYAHLIQYADDETLLYLKHDLMGRAKFTRYLVSFYLFDTLVHDFFFNEKELQIFDNLLPKLNGVAYAKQRNKRAYY